MPDVPLLDAAEQRILGSLLEKQVTVPASYPLSLNSLRTACNQSSSRDPVTDYDEQEVERVARALKDRGLVRIVWADTGRRTLKYHQTLAELLDLGADERAVLTVLLLRGEQPAGALKTRTERLFAFADRQQVEEVLARLAARPEPLVRELPRQAGQHDNRWTHLLGTVQEAVAAVPEPEPVLDGTVRDERVRTSYAAVSSAYADHLADELDHLPFESWLLRRVAELAGNHPVVEVGCGPGHVTHFLAEAGVRATGMDLTPAMVEEARRRFPDGDYVVGDLRSLMRPTDDAGWGAVLAWYSLCHLAPAEIPEALSALTRPLLPGGWLVVALHAGTGTRELDSWFDIDVDVTFFFHDPARLRAVTEAAGLVDPEWYHRGPVTSRGETTERFYLLARKPG
ncbi:MAG TPA: DUF480 domain-containing protein [Nocardioides sp.]|nr:DUF480 domain-containing protein [Nocardioides sp.]